MRYYNEDIAYFNGKKYYIESQADDEIILKSSSHKIKVIEDGHNRIVDVNGLSYNISWMAIREQYIVTYPSGQQLRVGNEAMHVFTMDDKLYFPEPTLIVVDGKVISSDPHPKYENYYPTDLVKVAYERYYEKQGTLQSFFTSLLLASFGITLFFNQRLQLFLFMLSHRLDVVDP